MNDVVFELHNYRFTMHMLGGFQNDVWALSGNVYGKPGFGPGEFLFTSTPVAYDSDTDVVTTYSGSRYKLVNPAVKKDEVVRDILNAIENGYERH